MNVLVIASCYLPGYKAGGPIRSLANLVDHLGDEIKFRIITPDRDFKDSKPYTHIRIDSWNRVGKADIFYISPKQRLFNNFKKLICSIEYDVLYLNSFFSYQFTIKPLLFRRLCMIPEKPTVVAPRGEFSSGALKLKILKKQLYIMVAKMLGLYRDVIWQASSEHEEEDIRKLFGGDIPVVIAPNLTTLNYSVNELSQRKNKKGGYLKILFLSRISKKKNLDTALKMLVGLNGRIWFDIYGPIEDKHYWAKCQKIIADLPGNIKVSYCGCVSHEKVLSLMSDYELFFLPTLGENFGHVIVEAFCAGCPVLISDQTPWRDLEEKGIGWDIPLNRPDLFQNVLQKCIDMNGLEYVKWSNRAREYGFQITKDARVVEQNRQLFHYALSQINKRI